MHQVNFEKNPRITQKIKETEFFIDRRIHYIDRI